MGPPSLRRRIRNGTLSMLGIALVFGALALPRIHRLGGAIRATLYRNYSSIKSVHQMEKALYELAFAECTGTLNSALPANRTVFSHWLAVEKRNVTEAGEGRLVSEVEQRWEQLQGRLEHLPSMSSDGKNFSELHDRLEMLAEINEAAMFRADGRANIMSNEVAYEFAVGLTLLLVVGTVLSLTLARNISHPLSELSNHLRHFNLPGQRERLTEQPLAATGGGD